MRTYRTLMMLLLAVCMTVGLMPAAQAEGEHLAGKNLDEILMEFMQERGVTEYNAAFGYYNTVTGEEYYYNADRYMDAASMYKVPLNMVFAERVANGQLDPEGEIAGISYPYVREETIVSSSNDWAAFLWEQLGGYNSFRRTIAPYMGEDPDTVNWKYYENNFFTPRQMICCLRLLYEENERFPEVVETMLRAEPESYFAQDERRFPIAHKYGYNVEDSVLHLNDCGIVFTDDPILLVCFTSGISDPWSFLADYCTLMCDYTQLGASGRTEQPEVPTP